MVVEPKLRNFLCLTAHPTGCKKIVENQINYTKNIKNENENTIKNVLIIGSSMGYGLSSRIVSIFKHNANTLGVSLEKTPLVNKTGSAGYYNDKALREFTKNKNLYFESINADAFSKETKELTIEKIKSNMKKVDLIIYSIASPKRTIDGVTYHSYLKTIDRDPFEIKSLNFSTNQITETTIKTATQEEIDSTVKVMGGEDWFDWIEALKSANVLSNNFKTISYSYIGPKLISPIYRDGTIGEAKKHLEKTIPKINNSVKSIQGKAHVVVCKALVTQASVAIPGIGLYTSILYKIMKKKETHEGCIEQINRLFRDHLFNNEEDIIRIDDMEMDPEVQNQVSEIFKKLTTENYPSLSDKEGVKKDFMNIFGFDVDEVDYQKDQDIS